MTMTNPTISYLEGTSELRTTTNVNGRSSARAQRKRWPQWRILACDYGNGNGTTSGTELFNTSETADTNASVVATATKTSKTKTLETAGPGSSGTSGTEEARARKVDAIADMLAREYEGCRWALEVKKRGRRRRRGAVKAMGKYQNR